MKFTVFLLFTGLAMAPSSAMAIEMTCQSILSVGNGNFGQLISAGSCDVGDITFSAFNTTFTATNITVAANGSSGSPFGAIVGFTYNYLNGVFPGGSIGYTATFDPNAATDGAGGTACPVNSTCGITGVEVQLNALIPSGAVVSTTYSGGLTGTSSVDALTLADETYQALIPLVRASASVTKLATYNGLGVVNTFSTEVIQGTVSTTPEPATFGLGAGVLLLGAGLLRRRKTVGSR